MKGSNVSKLLIQIYSDLSFKKYNPNRNDNQADPVRRSIINSIEN
jgi:hypothetical protein